MLLTDLLAILTTWRISSLLVREAGPYDIFAKIRALFGVTYDVYSNCVSSGLGGVFCCLWCMSIWIGAIVAFALALYRHDDLFIWVLNTFAFSAGAIVVEKVIR